MPPVVGFVGGSGSGKTTLITAGLPALDAAEPRGAVPKHAHHGFDMDRPGKDSFRARAAGATQVPIASRLTHSAGTPRDRLPAPRVRRGAD